MRKTALIRVTIIVIVILLIAAVLTAFFRGEPKKLKNMVGMEFSQYDRRLPGEVK